MGELQQRRMSDQRNIMSVASDGENRTDQLAIRAHTGNCQLPSVSLKKNHYLKDLDLGLKEGDLRPSSTSRRLWLDSKSWCSKAAL